MDTSNPSVRRGRRLFQSVGCADCHVPELHTTTSRLTYSFPEVETDPSANVFYSADLARGPARFTPVQGGGVRVPAFSDLKRHDMGRGLAESPGSPLASMFVTARLWGIADTAPYLHDGRALTLTDAVLLHGGEGQAARDAFARLQANERIDLLTFLRSLRTPEQVATDLVFDR